MSEEVKKHKHEWTTDGCKFFLNKREMKKQHPVTYEHLLLLLISAFIGLVILVLLNNFWNKGYDAAKDKYTFDLGNFRNCYLDKNSFILLSNTANQVTGYPICENGSFYSRDGNFYIK